MKIQTLLPVLFIITVFTGCRKEGCTSDKAYNFDEDARKDNGTCRFLPKPGEEYGGGWCYLKAPGIEKFNHYLIAAKEDIGTGSPWGCMGTQVVSNEYGAIGRGPFNTKEITDHCTEPWIAAKLCLDHTYGSHTDWVLPSSTELSSIKEGRSYVPGIVDGVYYWSSTEIDANTAIAVVFYGSTSIFAYIPKTTLCRVRPTKYFYTQS